MDSFNFKGHLLRITNQRNVFLFISCLLSVAIILLSVLLYKKQERVVIVPTAGSSFWIEEGQTSSGYLESMGVYLSDLLLNRSPADVEWRNKKVLLHIHHSFYHQAKKHLEEERETLFKHKEASVVFRPSASYVDSKKQTFFIEGERLVLVGKEGKEASVAQRDKQRYVLGFKCENSRLYLTSIKKEDFS